MPLTFPRHTRQLDVDADAISFPAQDGEKTIRCRVVREALRDWFRASSDRAELLDVVDRNRPRIEALASRKYDRGDSAETVSVTLTPGDQ